MSRKVIGTKLFYQHLKNYLDAYAGKGAVRFVDKLWVGYEKMLADISAFEEIGRVRRRPVQGKTITVHEYLIDAGARNFLVLYWRPKDPGEPIVLLNIRIGGQNRFRWK